MDAYQYPLDEVLRRQGPFLELIFEIYGVSEVQALEVLADAGRILLTKRLRRGDPDAALLSLVFDRLERIRKGGESLEDPSE
jgi:hypothetical protein